MAALMLRKCLSPGNKRKSSWQPGAQRSEATGFFRVKPFLHAIRSLRYACFFCRSASSRLPFFSERHFLIMILYTMMRILQSEKYHNLRVGCVPSRVETAGAVKYNSLSLRKGYKIMYKTVADMYEERGEARGKANIIAAKSKTREVNE